MLDAPFPWFGGKRKVAGPVWQRFGNVNNYVEPFFGSGAVLLGRPTPAGIETINDIDGYIANFWRAIKMCPDEVAEYADWPVSENDLHARHVWLLAQRDTLAARLEGDFEWCDPKIAGYWVWGICCWIGSGWCSGNGSWGSVDGKLVKLDVPGVKRQHPHVGNNGMGINRQRLHLSDNGQGVNRQLLSLGDNGRGVNRQLVHLSDGGQGVAKRDSAGLFEWFGALSERLRYIRVCSGDWARICGKSPTFKLGTTAVFLDPPYGDGARRMDGLYRIDDAAQLSSAVREWAIEAGARDDMRIALCGYDGEHAMPDNWETVAWKAPGGYGLQAIERTGNEHRERIWFSPACLKPKKDQATLW